MLQRETGALCVHIRQNCKLYEQMIAIVRNKWCDILNCYAADFLTQPTYCSICSSIGHIDDCKWMGAGSMPMVCMAKGSLRMSAFLCVSPAFFLRFPAFPAFFLRFPAFPAFPAFFWLCIFRICHIPLIRCIRYGLLITCIIPMLWILSLLRVH